MKVTYKQIDKAIEPLMELSNKEMDYKMALKISRNLREFEKYYEEYRDELAKLQNEYVDRDEEGNPIQMENGFKIKDGMVEEFKNKLTTLDEFEVEVNVHMLREEDFVDLKITPSILMGIDFLIDED